MTGSVARQTANRERKTLTLLHSCFCDWRCCEEEQVAAIKASSSGGSEMKPVASSAKSYLQSFLDGLRERVPTVAAVLVSDSDGVVLMKSVAQAYQENSVDATLAAVFAASTAQASKLQFGQNRAVVSWQKDRVVIHVNTSPFFVSIICSKDTGDVGALLAMAPSVVKVRLLRFGMYCVIFSTFCLIRRWSR
jgi:mitogen-activated protein kinase kinase 1 interacting protein 1